MAYERAVATVSRDLVAIVQKNMRKVQTHSQQQQRQALLENQKPSSLADEVGGLRREPRMTTVVAPTGNRAKLLSAKRATLPSPLRPGGGLSRPHILEID